MSRFLPPFSSPPKRSRPQAAITRAPGQPRPPPATAAPAPVTPTAQNARRAGKWACGANREVLRARRSRIRPPSRCPNSIEAVRARLSRVRSTTRPRGRRPRPPRQCRSARQRCRSAAGGLTAMRTTVRHGFSSRQSGGERVISDNHETVKRETVATLRSNHERTKGRKREIGRENKGITTSSASS